MEENGVGSAAGLGERESTRLEAEQSPPQSVGRDSNVLKSGGTMSVEYSILGGDGNTVNVTIGETTKKKSEIAWADLIEEKQKELLMKPLMVLQGNIQNKLSLRNILGNVNQKELVDLIDEYTIYDLMHNNDIRIGDMLPELGEIETDFLPRTFISLQNEESLDKGLRAIIEGMQLHETVIISDEAGSGKSTILKMFAKETKKMFPSRWVIYVNLIEYSTVFEKRLDMQFKNTSEFVDIFVTEIYSSKDNFERNLLKLCLEKSGGVVLLFDGFDEISPKYENIVIELLLSLKTSRVDNLILTTRPYAAEDLENKLEALSYRLRPFNCENKLTFLVNYWLHKSNFDDKMFLESKAKQILQIFSSSVEGYESDFMGVPLQCRLLAEIYGKKLNSEEKWVDMSLYEMYQQFIEIKFEEEEIKYQSTASTSGTENNFLTKVRVQEYHWESAFRLLQGEDIVNRLKFYQPKKKEKIYLLKKVERVGIMTVTGEYPVFIHRTFAEFFVAEFFIESIEDFEGDDFVEVLKILLIDILSNNRHGEQVVRLFFESGLKTRTIKDEKFRRIQSSILKSWRLYPEPLFRGFFRSRQELDDETYRFLVNCLIVDGHMPIEFFPLVTELAPPKYLFEFDNSVDNIFYHFLSSCRQTIQEIIVTEKRYNLKLREWKEYVSSFTKLTVKFPSMSVSYESVAEKRSLLENFHLASTVGDVQRLEELLQEAGDDETRFWLLNTGVYDDKWDIRTAVDLAILGNRGTTLRFLLDRGAPLNQRVKIYYSDITAQKLELNKIYRDGKAGGSLKFDGETPLSYACRRNKKELFIYLLDRGCDRGDVMAWYQAIQAENADMVRILLDRGFDVNQHDEKNQTPLHYAAKYCKRNLDGKVRTADNQNIIKTLVSRGADMNAADQQGKTALHIAIKDGTPGAVQTLLVLGANAEVRDVFGGTAIFEASVRHEFSEEIVTILLGSGSDIEARDYYLRTALHFVSEENPWNVDFASILLKRGANTGAEDESGNSPLHLAVTNDCISLIGALLAHGANIEAVNQNGETPLLRAARNKSSESLSFLLEKGANIEAKDKSHRTALHAAADYFYSDVDIIRVLMERGANGAAKDEDGNTPLQLAVIEWDRNVEPLPFRLEGSTKLPTEYSLQEAVSVFTREEISSVISAEVELFTNVKETLSNQFEKISVLSEPKEKRISSRFRPTSRNESDLERNGSALTRTLLRLFKINP